MNITERLTTLLNAFYGGTAGPDDISEIIRIFRSHRDLPQEFDTDRDIFLSMSQADNTDVPDDLGSMISDTVDSLAAGERRTRRRLWLQIGGIAAAVAVLAAIGAHFLTGRDLTVGTPMLDKTTATATASAAGNQADTIPAPQLLAMTDAPASLSEAPAPTPTPAAVPRKKKPSAASGATTKAADVIVVTDPKEAEAYTVQALRMIGKSVKAADLAKAKTRETITDINNKLESILK